MMGAHHPAAKEPAPVTLEEQRAVLRGQLMDQGARIAALSQKVDALRLALERWQDVAFIDSADLAPRARHEGITVETGLECPWSKFLKEFYKKASVY